VGGCWSVVELDLVFGVGIKKAGLVNRNLVNRVRNTDVS
jgi:hypothetical protein